MELVNVLILSCDSGFSISGAVKLTRGARRLRGKSL